MTAARSELERLGVAHRRPDDFFAEMLKSDEHMQKIKDKVLTEQRKMSAVESRRKQRDSLKHVKEVAAERLKAKAAEKRALTDTLKQWKRHRGDAEHAGAARERALEAAVAPGRAPPRPGAQSFKRRGKEGKYGHGGQKRYLKDNTARSSADMGDFSAARNKALPPGVAFKGAGRKVREGWKRGRGGGG